MDTFIFRMTISHRLLQCNEDNLKFLKTTLVTNKNGMR